MKKMAESIEVPLAVVRNFLSVAFSDFVLYLVLYFPALHFPVLAFWSLIFPVLNFPPFDHSGSSIMRCYIFRRPVVVVADEVRNGPTSHAVTLRH